MSFVFNFDTNVSQDDIKAIFERFNTHIESKEDQENGDEDGLDSNEFQHMILSFAGEKADA
jgi:hypothetical protein